MINQIGDLKLSIDQQTGEFVWASDWVRIYATRNDSYADRLVELLVWAKDENGNEYSSDGEGFFLSPGNKAEQMAEYIKVIEAIESEMYSDYFWNEEIKNLDGFLAHVFSQKINKFLTK
jgi:hypothetical protein